jgi:hypothetical protein
LAVPVVGERLYLGPVDWKDFIEEKDTKSIFVSLVILYRFFRLKNITPQIAVDMYNLFLPSEAWFDRQYSILQNVTQEESDFLRLYTFHGDVFLNSYLRNGRKVSDSDIKYVLSKSSTFRRFLSLSEPTEDLRKKLQDFAERFYSTLQSLISNSPLTDKEFIVYRGQQQLYRADRKGDFYTTEGFTSTSLKLNVALEFSRHATSFSFSYLEYIIVPVGSRVLLNDIHSELRQEKEVMFPVDSRFRVIEECGESEIIQSEKVLFSHRGKACLVEYISEEK